MAWTAIYEDLSEHASKETSPSDLPLDGLQAVIVDGKVFCGFNILVCRKQRKKWQLAISKAPLESFRRTRNTVVIRGKTTSTRQYHKIQKRLGLWSPENKPREPSDDWEKDVIGWRLWTDTEVFEGRLPEDDWVNQWKTIPDRVQGVMLYENWKSTPTSDYRQEFAGLDVANYFIAPSPYGAIFGLSSDDHAVIASRYPGAVIREGTLLPDAEWKAIRAAMNAAKEL